VLAGAAQTLFTRLTGQEILLGALSPDSLDAAGQPFVNPVALRLPAAEGRSWLDFLAAVNRTVAEAARHRDYPFAQVVRQSVPAAFRLDHAPVFQLMLVLLNQPNLGQTPVSPVDVARVRDITAACDVTLVAVAEAGGLRLECEYDAELFDRPLSSGCWPAGGAAHQPVGAAGASRGRPAVGHARRAPPTAERVERHPGRLPPPGHHPPTVWAQAARTPEAIALAFAGQVLTYRQLEEQANRLARYLLRLGVGPEVLVGLFVERSLEMVVGMLAVLKDGGAYVPLDTAYPAERLALMQADARYPVILTQSSLLPRLPLR
jgi:non-ribosomal peptide synthetase component F